MDALQRLRKSRGYSQQQIADELGISRQTYSNYELGKREANYETLRRLADREDAMGLMPCGFAKADLFPYIRRWGVLPRKTFSMGHAHEKRYYFEARKIEK